MIPLIDIVHDAEGIFLQRKNRFLGMVKIEKEEQVHIHDPGRLKELLYAGNTVLLKKASGKSRKTAWDLIAAKHEENWILVHSGYHRALSQIILESLYPEAQIKPEVKLGHSRIDFIVQRKSDSIAVEVKGCTLSEHGVALFPDAPTTRGRRHVRELINYVESGHKALLLILIFRPDSKCFLPNSATDPEFAKVFWNAVEKGVEILPIVLSYDGKRVWKVREISICR